MQPQKGKLVRWVEDKGFGFIKPDDGAADIFIHISALRTMSRSPVVGDIIIFETSFDDKGKICAINAKIEGVPPVLTISPVNNKNIRTRSSYQSRQDRRLYSTYRPPDKKGGFKFVLILLVVAIVYALYYDNSRPEKRTLHAAGDGTFIVDGYTLDRKEMMRSKRPDGFETLLTS